MDEKVPWLAKELSEERLRNVPLAIDDARMVVARQYSASRRFCNCCLVSPSTPMMAHEQFRQLARAISLPLFVGAIGMSVVSTLHPLRLSTTTDYYGSRADRADYEVHHCIGLCNGVIYAQAVRRGIPAPGIQIRAVKGYPAAYAPTKTALGFNFHWVTAPHWHFREVDFPLWPVAIVGAIIPMRKYLHRRRLGWAGLCRICHYDLTGNVSGVCPERGTAAV